MLRRSSLGKLWQKSVEFYLADGQTRPLDPSKTPSQFPLKTQQEMSDSDIICSDIKTRCLGNLQREQTF